jgi:hypothetical protein
VLGGELLEGCLDRRVEGLGRNLEPVERELLGALALCRRSAGIAR